MYTYLYIWMCSTHVKQVPVHVYVPHTCAPETLVWSIKSVNFFILNICNNFILLGNFLVTGVSTTGTHGICVHMHVCSMYHRTSWTSWTTGYGILLQVLLCTSTSSWTLYVSALFIGLPNFVPLALAVQQSHLFPSSYSRV